MFFLVIDCVGLKKLSLRNLDGMPKLTNTLFDLVIQHLPLTHFCITTETPLRVAQVFKFVNILRRFLKTMFAYTYFN